MPQAEDLPYPLFVKPRDGMSSRLYTTEDQGVASSRNTGVAQARGDYIALLDGDDLWDSTKLEVQVTAAWGFPQSGIIVANGVHMGPLAYLTALWFHQ
jgi:glycosyltransferase involved in cell wall biosynthesis